MKNCELCKSRARIFCESDEATLCWDCDARVHSANFLVARHNRTLLCHTCQSLTPWTASGSDLGRSFCVCHSCFTSSHTRNDINDDAQSQLSINDQQEDEDEDEGDNQVVPWTSSPCAPAVSLASSDEDAEVVCGRVYAKRMRPHVSDLGSQTSDGEELDSVRDTRKSLKHRRIRRSVEEDKSAAFDFDLNN